MPIEDWDVGKCTKKGSQTIGTRDKTCKESDRSSITPAILLQGTSKDQGREDISTSSGLKIWG